MESRGGDAVTQGRPSTTIDAPPFIDNLRSRADCVRSTCYAMHVFVVHEEEEEEKKEEEEEEEEAAAAAAAAAARVTVGW